jgi:hypothetical protein
MLRLLPIYIWLLFFITGCSTLHEGLQAYYPFNGNANDVSRNKNNPIFNNATLTADRFGSPNSAYHFNGIDNYMQILNSLSLNPSQISICAWVRVTGFYYGPCHSNRIIMKGNADYTPTGNYRLTFDDSYYTNGANCSNSIPDTLRENFSGVNARNITGSFLNKNEWYFLVYTYDGTTARLYQNSKLVDSLHAPLSFTNGDDLFFGRLNNVDFPYWFNGDLDEVRIYNRAISQKEVRKLANCHN